MRNKKLFLLSVTSLLMFSIVGCGGNQNDNSDDQTNNSTSEPEPEKEMVDLSEYTINITDAKNIGIRHKNEKPKKKMLNANNLDAQEEINTLVKTTTEYKEGTTEVVEQDINVTFTKIDTTVTTKTVDGTKNYISYGATQNEDGTYKDDAKISIPTLEGYDYTVYDEANSEVIIYDKVVDNAEADLDKNPGVLELGGLKHNYSYTVKYHGVGEETTITESEIGAEIDKVYVYDSNLTFISYVPVGTSHRPMTKNLKLNQDGQSEYDSKDYYSGSDRQSFVCDNRTGNIYKLGDDENANNARIREIKNGVLYMNENSYPFTLSADNNALSFKQIYGNPAIPFYYAFKDKFGNNYVCNEKFYDYKEDVKTYFFTMDVDRLGMKTDLLKDYYYYMLCDDGRVIRMPSIIFNGALNSQSRVERVIFPKDNTIEITDNNGKFRQILPSDEANILKPEILNVTDHYIFKLKNLQFYSYKCIENQNQYGFLWHGLFDRFDFNIEKNDAKSSFIDYEKHMITSSGIKYAWMNYAANDVFFEATHDGKLYAYNNWFGSDLTAEPELLLENFEIEEDTGTIVVRDYFGNQRYDIFVEKQPDGTYKGKTVPEGTPFIDDGNVREYTFHPINR